MEGHSTKLLYTRLPTPDGPSSLGGVHSATALESHETKPGPSPKEFKAGTEEEVSASLHVMGHFLN